ncbi:hypothetical protein FNV43_RR10025 [Rhamnella rubrinervis]|uniref:UTP--glucose-1-phosphate uridylyltransferase n=1 Tax=Rhamnella rubrinervis TaxID=2594499 RepID=A0A8K0HB19_9ROSA|nr:hypothetical protein FNV43_RR10025 [Rhamnella rubrinervis]
MLMMVERSRAHLGDLAADPPVAKSALLGLGADNLIWLGMLNLSLRYDMSLCLKTEGISVLIITGRMIISPDLLPPGPSTLMLGVRIGVSMLGSFACLGRGVPELGSLELRTEVYSELRKEEHGTSGRRYHNVVRRRLGSDIKAGQRPGRDASEQFPLARMWTAKVSSPHLDGQGSNELETQLPLFSTASFEINQINWKVKRKGIVTMSPLHSIVIQKLLSTNAHLGRRVVAHHFKMFTYGTRNGMAIIDSDKTLICLRNAAEFIAALAQERARFMFVNTNSLFDEIVEHMTKKIGCYSPSMNTLWRTGGFLTNSCSPKKFRSRNKKVCFGPTQPPDCLVVFDTERKSSVILEADRLQIPIVSLVDSAMPLDYYKRITYPIPANDSVQFVYLFCNLITKTFLLQQQKRSNSVAVAAAAKEDQVERNAKKEGCQIEESNSKNKSQSHKDGMLLVLPYDSLPSISPNVAEAKELLDKLVVVKFNAILGTDMGFDGPKSTIEFQKGLTFLDLFITQIESLNSKYGCNLPLLLVNTIRTHKDTEKVVAFGAKIGPSVFGFYRHILISYSCLCDVGLGEIFDRNVDIHAFEQIQCPQPKSDSEQSSKDGLYTSDNGAVLLYLISSGTIDLLLSQGKEYILVVSSDNVASIVDPKILKHLIENKIEYCMEVTPTSSCNSNTTNHNSCQEKFELDEIVQNSVKYSGEKFKLINTGSLWVNLRATKKLVDANALKIEDLSVLMGREDNEILSSKTAAGSTIQFFDRAVGVNVPQSRFLPVNSTSDLLLLQSTLYTNHEGVLVRNKDRINTRCPVVDLGREFEKVTNFQTRMKSIPNIMELESLKVSGDVWFGTGRVTITAEPGMKLEIPDGVVLENKEISDPADIC